MLVSTWRKEDFKILCNLGMNPKECFVSKEETGMSTKITFDVPLDIINRLDFNNYPHHTISLLK